MSLARAFLCAAGLIVGLAAMPAWSSELLVEPVNPRQGQTLVVRVAASEPDSHPQVEFNGKSYQSFPLAAGASDKTSAGSEAAERDDLFCRTLIGIPADLEPGSYDIKCGGQVARIKVVPGTFGVQRISLPKGKDNFISSPGEEDTVKAAKATCTSEQHWQGRFHVPSPARVSAGFGLRRAVNGRILKDYFHSGIDYAGGLGSPVKAVEGGKVLIAHKGWRLHGNCVCIDHGQGVVSFYIHLNSIAVKEGQAVKVGQTIGTIGATGRANGPHLHFSIYVNGNATNPGDWYRNVY